MFENQMNRKIVATNGNHFFAILSSMFPRVIWSRMNPKAVSTTVWTRLGRCSILRATSSIVAIVRIVAIRT